MRYRPTNRPTDQRTQPIEVLCRVLKDVFRRYLFFHINRLVCEILKNMSNILQQIVSTINGVQLQEIVSRVLLGHLCLLPTGQKRSLSESSEAQRSRMEEGPLIKLIKASLEWESIEQMFLWQVGMVIHLTPYVNIL